MERIDDTTLSILLKLASKASLDADVEMYHNLDVSDCEISKKTKRKFRRNLAWELGRSTRRKVISIAKRVAVICLAVCSLLFGTAMCIEPIRAAFIEAVITWYEDYIGFRFVNEEKVEYPSTIEKVYLPENLSDEWVVTKVDQRPTIVTHRITGIAGENIRLVQTIISEKGSVGIDNTDAIIDEIELNDGTKAYLITYTKGQSALIWYKKYCFEIVSENVSLESMLSIANGIK